MSLPSDVCPRCGAVHVVISAADIGTERDCAYMMEVDLVVAGILPEILSAMGFDVRSRPRNMLENGAKLLVSWSRRQRKC